MFFHFDFHIHIHFDFDFDFDFVFQLKEMIHENLIHLILIIEFQLFLVNFAVVLLILQFVLQIILLFFQ